MEALNPEHREDIARRRWRAAPIAPRSGGSIALMEFDYEDECTYKRYATMIPKRNVLMHRLLLIGSIPFSSPSYVTGSG